MAARHASKSVRSAFQYWRTLAATARPGRVLFLATLRRVARIQVVGLTAPVFTAWAAAAAARQGSCIENMRCADVVLRRTELARQYEH